jgi:serine/threonine-protein kinase HipA
MEFRSGSVQVGNRIAGRVFETELGYRFEYDPKYLLLLDAEPISLTMPLQAEPYDSKTMFPFFDGLIPEGWLLEVAEKTWKLDARDRMGLLLHCCGDCIGKVSVTPERHRR